MLTNYTPAQYREETAYELVFDDGCNNGYGFPCGKDGSLLESEAQNPAAHKNLRFCLEHPERFERFNKILERRFQVKDNAHGTCTCGADVELWDQYLGACQCPKCERWYNLFGQELLPPKRWEESEDW